MVQVQKCLEKKNQKGLDALVLSLNGIPTPSPHLVSLEITVIATQSILFSDTLKKCSFLSPIGAFLGPVDLPRREQQRR